ncbi:FAD-dependent oxidoreductase [Candidatus Entotheonella palauensis]|uniref:FAD-dependent oxidoreductase n=1 Tax=Candidatus Entotheonella palauensis TaxID=93172 RepID=UPI0015C43B37|nr:FAD-dependent oxidoreductase [Candidatus Entotheonella palauensis]
MAFGAKVAVVGGSIAGCAAAIALQRIGCEVTVYERSTGQLVDRGAGLGIPLSLLQTLVARDLVDADMVHFEATKCPFVLRSDDGERDAFQGRILWEQPIAVAVTNWSVLYRQLRSRVPDGHYHQGHEVIDIRETGDEAVSVHLSDGRIVEFDLVVCADGQHSVGRRLLFPDQSLQYVGYIYPLAWSR